MKKQQKKQARYHNAENKNGKNLGYTRKNHPERIVFCGFSERGGGTLVVVLVVVRLAGSVE